MTTFWSLFSFIAGAILGSFFNVVGLRLPLEKDFVKARSKCTDCGKILSWYELIPIISYIVQKGKCCHCHTSISRIYPFMELFSGLLFLYAYMKVGWHPELIVVCLLISLSVIVIVSDLKYMIIPNQVLLFFLPLFLTARILLPLDPWHDTIYGAIGASVVIGTIIIISQGGMGYGDLKLLMLFGFMLGFQKMLLAFMVAVCLGAVISAGLLLMKKAARKTHIPFAPYITVGVLISYFYGTDILLWYMELVHINMPM